MVLETRKSYNLPFVSWRTGTASGVIQSKSAGPRTDVQGRKRWPCPLKKRERKSALSSPLCPIWTQWIGLDSLAHNQLREVFLIQSTESMQISPRNTLKTHPEMMFYRLSGHPLAQLSCHRQLTIMFSNPAIPFEESTPKPSVYIKDNISEFFVIAKIRSKLSVHW